MAEKTSDKRKTSSPAAKFLDKLSSSENFVERIREIAKTTYLNLEILGIRREEYRKSLNYT
jgi:hypothetical protein